LYSQFGIVVCLLFPKHHHLRTIVKSNALFLGFGD